MYWPAVNLVAVDHQRPLARLAADLDAHDLWYSTDRNTPGAER